MCVHPLNKDVTQAVIHIGTFYQCPFPKMVGWVSFYLIVILALHVLSFLTGKEYPGECVHCRSPHQKTYTVDSLLMDTSAKWTPRVGPCLSLLPLFDSP